MRLRQIFTAHRGEIPVKLVFHKPNHSETTLSLPSELRVTPSEELINEVEQLFGEPSLSFR